MAGAQQPQGGGGPCAARAAGWRCPNCRELGLFPLLRVGRFDAMPFPSYLNLVEKIFFFFRKLITGRVFRAALDGGISRISTASSARAVLGFPRSLQRTEPLKRQNPLNPQAAQGPAVSVESPVEDSVLLTGFISSQDLTYISKAGDTTPQHSELGPLQVYVVGKSCVWWENASVLEMAVLFNPRSWVVSTVTSLDSTGFFRIGAPCRPSTGS